MLLVKDDHESRRIAYVILAQAGIHFLEIMENGLHGLNYRLRGND
jgi:hypothetical protein